MLHALRTLGELLGGSGKYDEIKASDLIVVDISSETGRIQSAKLRKFNHNLLPKILYTKHDAMKTPHVPTIKIQHGDLIESDGSLHIKESLRDKFRRSARNLMSFLGINIDIDQALKNVEDLLQPNIETWVATITFDGKFAGEIPQIRCYFEEKRRLRGRKSQRKSICAICGEEKEVSGDISPFTFYTVDKPGYVVGGFDKSLAYKAFPLCYDCRDLIQRGRQHVEANLTFDFVSRRIRYLLIPDFIFGSQAVRQDVLEILTEEREQRQGRLHTLSRKELKRITADAGDILDLLSEERDVMTFHFLFMAPKQGASSQERIELYIQDIYPSRLRALFRAKAAVDRALRIPREGGTWRDYNFTYATLYRFFSKADPNKRNPDLLRHFYDLVDRTFRAAPVSANYLIPFLMTQIRHDVVTPDRRDQGLYRFTILDALASLMFILFTTRKEEPMSAQTPSTLEAYLESLPALEDDLKKGLFLLGALTERLLRVQGQERGNAPFWKSLKSLKMNATDFQGLLPKVRNKLQEYDRFGRGEAILFQLASAYLAQTKMPWKMSVDELNFYFALGMGLFPQVAPYIYPKQDESQQEEVEA